MKKKILIGIIVVVALALCVYAGICIKRKIEVKNENNEIKENSKVLVVYFSAQGHTDNVAKLIAKNLNADIFKLEPVEEYTSDDLNYYDSNSRVTKEHNDESLRNVELKSTNVENFDSYDTVLIGYPIWWGIAAWPVNSFVTSNDFTGKTVIPFCTSASSGLGESSKKLASLTTTGNWLDGHRFSSSASETEIKEWINSINK